VFKRYYRRMRRAAAAGLLSDVLLRAATPAVGAGWLAWVALAPAAAVALGEGGRTARAAVPIAYCAYLELLLVPALPFGLTEGQFGDPFVPVLIGDSPVLVVALAAIPLLGLGLYAIRFGEPWLAGRLDPRLRTAGLVAIPALAWTGLELVRIELDPGASFGPLFVSQSDTGGGEIAALGGPWSLTFAIVAVGYGLGLAIARRRFAPALAAVAIAPALAIAAPAASEPPAGGITVAAVQPGYDTAEEDRPVLRFFQPGSWDRAALDLIADLGRLTRTAAAGGAELVVWPEASMYVDPRVEPEASAALRRLVRRAGVAIVVPYFVREERLSEVMAAVPQSASRAGAATLTRPEPKQRPMWFLGERSADDAGADPIPVNRLRVGALLGVDVQLPALARRHAERGATLLTSSTHDWAQLAPHHRAFARLAARATGLPLVRADWRYGSAIYGPDGEVLADAGTGLDRTVVLAEVPLGGADPYPAAGDAFGWVALGVSLALVLILNSRLPPRERARTRSAPARR
jgi:apolipoprotein N-acyltransferase